MGAIVLGPIVLGPIVLGPIMFRMNFLSPLSFERWQFMCVADCGLGSRDRQLLCIKICWLQGRRHRLVCRLGGLFLAALYALTHPFAHLWLVTQIPGQEQWNDGRSEPQATADFPFRSYNGGMASPIPEPIRGQKYVSLTTYRKNGVAVATPVWFGEEENRLYIMTRSQFGKYKRIRNNPRVRAAPCTIRGVVTGPEFAGVARILPLEEHTRARAAINRKYWMARIPFLWWRTDAYIEVTFP